MIEELLNENKILIYCVSIFCILINESFDKKQKIIILYMFIYGLKLFNIMDLKVTLMVLGIVSFIYIGFLSNDSLKNVILCNIFDKLKDYFYKCIFEYSAIYFLISILLISNKIQSNVSLLNYMNLNVDLLGIKVNIISLLLLAYAVNNITSQKFETNTFNKIKNKMDKAAIWTKIKSEDIDKEKLYMLVDIEDKSYFYREKSYNFLSLEFLKYKINRFINKKELLSLKTVDKSFLKKVYIKEQLKKIKRFIRGYSTIEMQLIRIFGVKRGYSEHVFCRKIYEFLYTKLFFKNLRKHMRRSYLNTEGCCTFKEYLLCVYINSAKIKLNGIYYENMLKAWNKKDLKNIKKEEFFISILGLSYRKINNDIIDNYYRIIEKYNLDTKIIEQLIQKINKV